MLTLLLLAALSAPEADLREAYDVVSYRLDIEVDPKTKTVRGASAVQFVVGEDQLDTFVLDLWSGSEGRPGLVVEEVFALRGPLRASGPLKGVELEFRHADDQVRCEIPNGFPAGTEQTIVVRYSGTPGEQDRFTGFHWETTADGSPWIGTSCQGTGAHWWWPCKASYFNPEDKPERVVVNATVPKGLYAVSNGRLVGRTSVEGERETFHWHHDYGCETYAVTLNVAPYVVVESELRVPGLEAPVPFAYYVLPENAAKARVQFEQVPELVAIYSDAFGPYPFPRAKFGLVETSFWGMEHSTAVAYGSSYPLWCSQNGQPDPWAARNRFFDYILVHEVAHEWWGNAVSAASWGHFWIHEGFATYAEGVYVERTQGRAAADDFFDSLRVNPHAPEVLYRGDDPTSGEAYTGALYSKGAVVLNTLRHFVADEEAWWTSLREFNVAHRGGTATTEDFRAVLERNTGRDWGQFFQEWFYGPGLPTLSGSVKAQGKKLVIAIDNPTTNERSFHVPLRIEFDLDGQPSSFRIELEPGENRRDLDLPFPITNVRVPGLRRIAGKHAIEVEG